MVSVPKYNENKIAVDSTPSQYQSANTNPDAFGASIFKAKEKLGHSINQFNVAIDNIQKEVWEGKALELSNYIDQLEKDDLLNPETGYYSKLGKEAIRTDDDSSSGAVGVLNSIDDKIKTKQQELGLTWGYGKKMADLIKTRKMDMLYRGASEHELKQTQAHAQNQCQIAVSESVQKAINHRDNQEDIQTAYNNGKIALIKYSQMQHLDENSIKLALMKYDSDFYSGITNAYISQNDLRAKTFFEENKDKIDPALIPNLIHSIDTMETKYNAKIIAQNILLSSKNEEEALNQAEKIEDEYTQNYVKNKLTNHYSTQRRFENQRQQELTQQFYSTVIDKANNGEMMSYDDIPDGLEPQTEFSFRNFIDKQGNVETDNQLYEELFEMRYNNAQGFLATDLYKYRGYLSESDFRHFLSEQEKLKKGDYLSQLDDEKLKVRIDDAIKNSGLKWTHQKTQNVWLSETKALVREFELRKGRKITDEELKNTINSLGYKNKDGVYLYKLYEEGMSKRTGFLRDVVNDISYYQKKHNGEFPRNEELSKIINTRVQQELQKEQTKAQQIIANFTSNSNYYSKINSITPKTNEQKVTTYFADVEIPEISKRLGFPVRVTSRYREGAHSHHGEGRAVDIGMARETREQRIKIYEELVKLPYVKAIGTSDPNILAHFNGNTKIIDERNYDQKHNTNHENHAHVTLFWDKEINQQNVNVAAGNAPAIAGKNGVFSL